MPGLIDAHCHMTYGESMTQEEQDIFTSVEGRTLRAAWNVQKVLAAGVTGVSQPGGSYFIGVAVRDGISEGRVKGPAHDLGRALHHVPATASPTGTRTTPAQSRATSASAATPRTR